MTDEQTSPDENAPEPAPGAVPTPRRTVRRILLFGLPALIILAGAIGVANADRLRPVLARAGITLPFQPEKPAPDELATIDERLARLESEPKVPVATANDQLAFGGRVAALEAEVQRLITENGALSTRIDSLMGYVADLSGSTSESHRDVRAIALVSFARHLVEQGRPLGAIADAADAEFRPLDASAADALAAWSQAPVSAATLTHQLDEIADTGTHRKGGWWAQLKGALAGLVHVHDGSAPDPLALAKARAAMHDDELETAIARMEKLPATPARDSWLDDARTLLATRSALDRIETLVLTSSGNIASTPKENPFAPPPVNTRPLPSPVL